MKKVLNVGGNTKAIALPAHFEGYEHLLLDIDPNVKPDILCDARELNTLDIGQFDAIYCSHNLEHYFRHEVPKVLNGFSHVLKDGGFAHIRVPDLNAVMREIIDRKLDIEDVLYESAAGPITGLDVFYGFGKQIEQSGVDFYAHKTGFTSISLEKLLFEAGFHFLFTGLGLQEVYTYAFKESPDAATRKRLNLPAD